MRLKLWWRALRPFLTAFHLNNAHPLELCSMRFKKPTLNTRSGPSLNGLQNSVSILNYLLNDLLGSASCPWDPGCQGTHFQITLWNQLCVFMPLTPINMTRHFCNHVKQSLHLLCAFAWAIACMQTLLHAVICSIQGMVWNHLYPGLPTLWQSYSCTIQVSLRPYATSNCPSKSKAQVHLLCSCASCYNLPRVPCVRISAPKPYHYLFAPTSGAGARISAPEFILLDTHQKQNSQIRPLAGLFLSGPKLFMWSHSNFHCIFSL